MHFAILQDWLRNGGTERQTLNLARYFHQSGIQVTLVNFRPGGRLERELPEGVARIVLQPFDTGLPLFAPKLMGTVKALSPDLILCMGRTANCYAGRLQRAMPDTPVITTIRTGKPLLPLHITGLHQSRGVLVNSKCWRDKITHLGISANKTRVIYNGLMLEDQSEKRRHSRNAIRRQMKAKPDTCVFLNIATFRGGKKHAELIRLFARWNSSLPKDASNWQLWLVGEGVMIGWCKFLARVLGISNKVIFLGYQRDTFPYYAGADIAVTTSREDSLPNFLIEAQSMQLPVVAYDYCGIGECFQNETSGYLHKWGDREGAMESLARLANNPALRARMGEAGKIYALEHFDWTRQASLTLEFLREHASPPNASN